MVYIALFSFLSCDRDFENFSNPFLSSNIKKAREWLDTKTGPILEMTPNDLGLHSISGKNSESPILFQYEWKHAFESENEDFNVVEVPLKTQGWFGMAEEETLRKFKGTKNIGYLSSITRLIIIRDKNNNKIEGYIMTILGDVDYLEKKKFQLLKNTYLQKAEDFSGMIFFRTLSGDFVNGWRMKDGTVTGKISESKKGINLTASGYCNTYAVYTTYQQCTDWYNVGETSDATYITYNGSTCNVWQEYSGSYTECETVYVNTGSGGSNGPYVQGGDTYCTSNLKSTMTPQMPNTCVSSIMEYINNEYCGGNVTEGFYLLDYWQTYDKNPIYGVDYIDVVNFANRHFETESTGFSGFQNAIDNGNIMMVGIPTMTPGIGHNVAVVGYKGNGDIIYMDPETGQFDTRPQSFFNSSSSYVIRITGCK